MKSFAPTIHDTQKSAESGPARDRPVVGPLSFGAGLLEMPVQRKASCACGGGCPACQSQGNDRLKISQPNDSSEIEADRIADQVMQAADAPVKVNDRRSHIPGELAAKIDETGEEEGDLPVQRKKANVVDSTPGGDAGAVRSALKSGGSPLAPDTRKFFESRFDTDLGHVRVHTGSVAERSARAVNARAYTHGSDIVFGSGEYDPAGSSGKRLLAHELAHVVQQQTGTPQHIARKAAPSPGPDPDGQPAELVSRLENGKHIYSLYGVDVLTFDMANVVSSGDIKIDLLRIGKNSYHLSVNRTSNISAEIDPDAIEKLSRKGYQITIADKVTPANDPEPDNGGSGITMWNAGPPAGVRQLTMPSDIELSSASSKKVSGSRSKLENRSPLPPPPFFRVSQKTPQELIDEYTSFPFMLDESGLAAALRVYAEFQEYDMVRATLDTLGNTDRDDVSEEFVRQSTDEQLEIMGKTGDGRKLLNRLYDELSSGEAMEGELGQNARILAAIKKNIDPEKFVEAEHAAIIIPFSGYGYTKPNSSSIAAELLPNGKIWVRSNMKTAEHFTDARLHNWDIMTKGIELDPNEIVGLHLYDEGGVVVYEPAIHLLQLSNTETTKAWEMAGETAFTVATLGTGAEVVVGAKVAQATVWGARAAKVLKAADYAAIAIGAATTVINEHRGWIIETFGDEGRKFISRAKLVEDIVGIYGMGRGVMGLGPLVSDLRKSYKAWRVKAELNTDLDADDKEIIKEIDRAYEKMIREIEDAQKKDKDVTPGSPAGESGGKSFDPGSGGQQVKKTPGPGTGGQQVKSFGVDDPGSQFNTLKETAPGGTGKKSNTLTNPVNTGKGGSSLKATGADGPGNQPTTLTEKLPSTGGDGPGTQSPVSETPPKSDKLDDILKETENKTSTQGEALGPGGKDKKNRTPKPGRDKKKNKAKTADKTADDLADKPKSKKAKTKRIANMTKARANLKARVEKEIKKRLYPDWDRMTKAEREIATKEIEKLVDDYMKIRAAHHLIPDEAVQKNWLYKLARERGYDLDRESNVEGLIRIKDKLEEGDVGHWTKHDQYNQLVKEYGDEIGEELIEEILGVEKKFEQLDEAEMKKLLDSLDPAKLDEVMKKIEDWFRELIRQGKVPMKDGHLAVITLEEDSVPGEEIRYG